jgi:hypothetical protein
LILAHLASPQCSPSFKETIHGWATNIAEPQLNKLTAETQQLKEEYAALLTFFAEPPTVQSNDFFAGFYQFATQLEVPANFLFTNSL